MRGNYKLVYLSMILESVCFWPTDSAQKCSIEEYQPCGEGATYVRGNLTSACVVTSTNQSGYTYIEARDFCSNNDMYLVEILDELFQENIVKAMNSSNTYDYWIGLTYQPNSQDFRWSRNTSEKIPYQNNELDPTEGHCAVVYYNTSNWAARDCKTRANYLCHKDKSSDSVMAPNMIVNYDLFPRYIFVGNYLTASCNAFVGMDHVLSFVMVGPDAKPIRFKHPEVVENEIIFRVNGMCRRRIHMTLTWHVTKTVDTRPSHLLCVSHRPRARLIDCDKYKSNCDNSSVHISYMNYPPKMTIEYHASMPIVHRQRPLVCHCTACVGLHGNISWASYREGYPLGFMDMDDPRISYDQEVERKECGIVMTSTLRVYVSIKMRYLKIACVSFNTKPPNYLERFNLIQTDSPPLIVKYGPRIPILTVYYHAMPDVVVASWPLIAKCTGCVGHLGSITWSVRDKNGQYMTGDNLTELNFQEERSRETNVPQCGNKEKSTLNLTVTTALRDAQLVCSTYNGTYLEGVNIEATSLKLVVPYIIDDGPPLERDDKEPVSVKNFFYLFIIFITLFAVRKYAMKKYPEVHARNVQMSSQLHRSTKALSRRSESIRFTDRQSLLQLGGDMTRSSERSMYSGQRSKFAMSTDVDTGVGYTETKPIPLAKLAQDRGPSHSEGRRRLDRSRRLKTRGVTAPGRRPTTGPANARLNRRVSRFVVPPQPPTQQPRNVPDIAMASVPGSFETRSSVSFATHGPASFFPWLRGTSQSTSTTSQSTSTCVDPLSYRSSQSTHTPTSQPPQPYRHS